MAMNGKGVVTKVDVTRDAVVFDVHGVGTLNFALSRTSPRLNDDDYWLEMVLYSIRNKRPIVVEARTDGVVDKLGEVV